MNDFDLSKETMDFQKNILALQTETLKKAQADENLKTEDIKRTTAVAALAGVVGGLFVSLFFTAKDIQIETLRSEIQYMKMQQQQK